MNFSKHIYNKVDAAIQNGDIYVESTRYSIDKACTKKIEEKNIIYCCFNDIEKIEKTNLLIHEIFHLVYFEMSIDTLEHERFVRKHHSIFLYSYKKDKYIKELIKEFLYSSYKVLLASVFSLEYEKYTYLDRIDDFFILYNKYYKQAPNEFIDIFKKCINKNNIFYSHKYLIPILDYYTLLEKLEEVIDEHN